MAWIELHQALRTHPKLFHLASLLGVADRDIVRAKLENLWLWALDYCPEGRLVVRGRDLTASEIASASNWTGAGTVAERGSEGSGNDPRTGSSDPKIRPANDPATMWLRALQESGWIEETPGGSGGKSLYLHDWHEYGGKLHAKRVADRERKGNRKVARNSDGIPSDGAGRNRTATADREENRTGEATDAVPPPPPPSAGPPPADLAQALETPDRGVGLLLLAAAAADLDPRLAQSFAAEIPLRELAAACEEAPNQTNPTGWLRRALEGRWKKDAPLAPARAAALRIQVAELRAKAVEKHALPGITTLRPKTPRKEGESEDEYARRIVEERLRRDAAKAAQG